jgi:hypothetical protein
MDRILHRERIGEYFLLKKSEYPTEIVIFREIPCGNNHQKSRGMQVKKSAILL